MILISGRALFGYEGQTNVLKVVSTGSDGLIELTEELNSGKILYGFVSITDDKTDLTKHLLINWQVGAQFWGFFFPKPTMESLEWQINL